MMQALDWLMVLGYFGVLAAVVVGTLRRHRIRSGEDLFLGVRRDRRVACRPLRLFLDLAGLIGRSDLQRRQPMRTMA